MGKASILSQSSWFQPGVRVVSGFMVQRKGAPGRLGETDPEAGESVSWIPYLDAISWIFAGPASIHWVTICGTHSVALPLRNWKP